MNGFFNMDSPFMRVMTKVCDLMIINILWIICCIPIITAGASTTAMYYMTMKMSKDEEGGIAAGFFKSFKLNFVESIPLTLLFYLFAFVLFFDFRIVSSSGSKYTSLIFGSLIAVGIIVAAVYSYVFPMLAKFENNVRGTLSNSLKIALSHPLQTICMLILNNIALIWFLFSPNTFIRISWFWFLLGFALVSYANAHLIVKIFEKLIPKDPDADAESDENWTAR
jgi:uncharacterized membrane protein YesL